MVVRNPTKWYPTSGQGYVIMPGLQKVQDNLGNLLIDNLGNNVVTNGIYTLGKYATAWTESGV